MECGAAGHVIQVGRGRHARRGRRRRRREQMLGRRRRHRWLERGERGGRCAGGGRGRVERVCREVGGRCG